MSERDAARQALFFVTPQGKVRDLAPPKASVFAHLATELPLKHPVANGRIFTGFNFLNQVITYGFASPSEIEEGIKDAQLQGLLPQETKSFEVVAASPNARFLLVQSHVGQENSPQGTTLWAVDVAKQRRRQLSRSILIQSCYSWAAERLTLSVQPNSGSNSKPRLGILSFPEATRPADSPQLDALVSQPPWEDAAPPVVIDPAQQAARAFLNDPALAPAHLYTGMLRDHRGNTVPDAREFSLSDAAGNVPTVGWPDDGFIALDPRTHQILAFNAPPPRPPLPNDILPPERAREAALAWASRHFAMTAASTSGVPTTAAAPDTSTSTAPASTSGAPAAAAVASAAVEPELSTAGRYVVRLVLAAPGASTSTSISTAAREWIVEVEAHSGKVAALRRVLPPPAPEVPGPDAPAPPVLQTNEDSLPAPAVLKPLFEDRRPRFSPDGSRLAWLSNRPRAGAPAWWAGRPFALWTARADGGEPRLLLEEVDARETPAWSPDGRRVAVRLSPTAGANANANANANAFAVVDVAGGQRLLVPSPKNPLITEMLLGWSAANEVLVGWAYNGPGSLDLMAWDLKATSPRRVATGWSDRMGAEWGGRAALLSGDKSTLWALWSVPDEASPLRTCVAGLWAWNARDWKQPPRRIAGCLRWGDTLQEQGNALLIAGRGGALRLPLPATSASNTSNTNNTKNAGPDSAMEDPWPGLEAALGTQNFDYGWNAPYLDAAVSPAAIPGLAFIAPRRVAISPGSYVLALHRVAPDGKAEPLMGAPVMGAPNVGSKL
jgi:hypothetical protein